VAQQPTYPGQNQTEMSPDQSQGQGESTRRKRVNQPETDGDQQSGEGSKQRKRERGNQTQTGSRESGDEGRASRRYDRDRYGDRRRSREGRYRYFHEGYYYATPWWTVGPGVVGVGGGIGCREGARIASRRGSTGSVRSIAVARPTAMKAGAVASPGASELTRIRGPSCRFAPLGKKFLGHARALSEI
jgi:hypothetical protein